MSTSQKEYSGSWDGERRDPTGSHQDGQRRQRRNNGDTEEIQESTEEDEGREGWTDNRIRYFTSVWNHEPRIQKLEKVGSERDVSAAV